MELTITISDEVKLSDLDDFLQELKELAKRYNVEVKEVAMKLVH